MNLNRKDLATMLKVWTLPLVGILAMLLLGFWSEIAGYFLFAHHLFWIIGITLLISPIAWTLRSSSTQRGGARAETPAERLAHLQQQKKAVDQKMEQLRTQIKEHKR